LIAHAKQKDLGLTEFYLAHAIDELTTVNQMPVLLKSFDMEKYKAFYSRLSQNLLLKIKPGK